MPFRNNKINQTISLISLTFFFTLFFNVIYNFLDNHISSEENADNPFTTFLPLAIAFLGARILAWDNNPQRQATVHQTIKEVAELAHTQTALEIQARFCNPEKYYELGKLHLEHKEFEAALGNFSRVPKGPSYEKAQYEITKIVMDRKCDDHTDKFNFLFTFNEKEKKYIFNSYAVKETLNASPQSVSVTLNLAKQLFDQKEFEKAKTVFSIIPPKPTKRGFLTNENEGNYSTAQYYLGLICYYQAKGKPLDMQKSLLEKARAFMNEAQKKFPAKSEASLVKINQRLTIVEKEMEKQANTVQLNS